MRKAKLYGDFCSAYHREMMMHTHDALIERLEKAQGPDRELDLAIGEAVGEADHSGPAHDRPFKNWARHYTASIDAALTLVPKHHLWELKQGIQCRAIVWMLETDYDDHPVPTGYSTVYPAIALCIAAIKAHK